MTNTTIEPGVLCSFLNQIIQSSPSTLYPTPIGKTDIDKPFKIILELLEEASGLDDGDVDLINYSDLLEKVLYAIYKDFNDFVQYMTLSAIIRANLANKLSMVRLGFPEDLCEAVDKSGLNIQMLILRSFTQMDNYPYLNIYSSDYNISGIISFYNLMPQHIKDLMSNDMEKILSSLYDVDKSNKIDKVNTTV